VVRQHAEGRGRGRGAPVRRLQTRDAPALLVDEYRQIVTSGQRAQVRGQRAQLRRGLAVAREQYEAGRRGRAEEAALVLAEDRPGEPEYRRAERHDGRRRPALRVRRGCRTGRAA
jgi:hypothetical protein